MKRALLLSLLLAFAFANSASAANITLPNLSQSDLETIVKEFSANFTFTSASPPSSTGKKLLPYLGFEVGAVGGITKSPTLDTLVTSEKIDQIPHVGAFLALSFQEGLGIESLFIPSTKVSGVKIGYTGFAGKWTITDSFWEWLPVNIALRAHWAKASLDFAQTINNSSTANTPVNANINLNNTIYGMNASVGHNFFDVVEPYFGLGFLKAKGEAKVLGTSSATIFVGSGFGSLTQTASSSPSSLAVFGGLQFNLLIVNLSAEAMRAFGTTNYTGKFSFDF